MFYSNPRKKHFADWELYNEGNDKNKVKKKGQKNKMWWLGKDCVKMPGYDHQPACGAQRFWRFCRTLADTQGKKITRTWVNLQNWRVTENFIY